MAPRKTNKARAEVSSAAAAKKAPSPSSTKKTAITVTPKPARYYEQIPLALRSKPKAERQQGLIGKFASAILGGSSHRKSVAPPRSFPFMTAAGPQYFCIDRKYCCAKFGVSHNDRLYYTSGPLAGSYCSVLGVRGGMLWVVNDVTKRGYDGEAEVTLPDFIVQEVAANPESASLFDNGFATPLYGISSAEDLAEAGIEFRVKGGMLPHTAAVDAFPSALVDFLKYAPDMTLELPSSAVLKRDERRLTIPPLVTVSGEVGWSSAGAIASFIGGSGAAADDDDDDATTEARALITIVPLLVPVEYLSDKEEEAEGEAEAEAEGEEAGDDAAVVEDEETKNAVAVAADAEDEEEKKNDDDGENAVEQTENKEEAAAEAVAGDSSNTAAEEEEERP